MKSPFIAILLFVFLSSIGCRKSNPVTPTPPGSVIDSNIHYQVSAAGMNALRPNEYYVLWVKIAPDSAWQQIGPLSIIYTSPDDSLEMVGKFPQTASLDSLKQVLITLERSAAPSSPGLVIGVSGARYIDAARSLLVIDFDSRLPLGNFDSTQGSLVFTSQSADSLAFNHEFYLMNLQNGKSSPSLTGLPAPPVGWKYAVWATDTNFTPHENFLFGLFSTPTGHDSDSAKDSYSYPGGWKPQPMNVGSGNIEVTLEPDWYGDKLKSVGASPFQILSFARIAFPVEGTNYFMKNVAVKGIPSGSVTFTKF